MASASATATRSEITIKGSVEIVTEFFGYAVNSILYQRGVYPPESFSAVAKYGLSLLVTTDEGLKTYLAQVLRQVAAWLSKGQVQKFVVVITGLESKAVLERWAFNVITDKSALAPGAAPREKPAKEIQGEIQALVRQITASVTFLPLLDEAASFDLLAYTDQDATVPCAWEDSDPRYIPTPAEVRLRSFDTSIHRVAPAVSFRQAPADDV